MKAKSDIRKLEAKKQEWDLVLIGFNKTWNKIKRELRIVSKIMFNFIFFYQPKDKFDKVMHLVEMLFVYTFVIWIIMK